MEQDQQYTARVYSALNVSMYLGIGRWQIDRLVLLALLALSGFVMTYWHSLLLAVGLFLALFFPVAWLCRRDHKLFLILLYARSLAKGFYDPAKRC